MNGHVEECSESPMVRIDFISLAGQSLEPLFVKMGETIYNVKQNLRQRDYVPLKDQILISKGRVLQDADEILTSLCLQVVWHRQQHISLVFLGQFNVGKSILCARVLHDLGSAAKDGLLDYLELRKNEHRSILTWCDGPANPHLVYSIDQIGREARWFRTEKHRVTVVDTPTAQRYGLIAALDTLPADVGILVVSAENDVVEMHRQIWKDVLLARFMGVSSLVIMVNKMDNIAIPWSQERYDQICSGLLPFLLQEGFAQNQLRFVPVSGWAGINIAQRKFDCQWTCEEDCFLEVLNSLSLPARCVNGPLRVLVADANAEECDVVVKGKVVQGIVRRGMECLVASTGQACLVSALCVDGEEVAYADAGELPMLRLTGVPVTSFPRGTVLSTIDLPLCPVSVVKVQLKLLQMPEGCPLITAGYRALAIAHTGSEECEILKILKTSNTSSAKVQVSKPHFVSANTQFVWCILSLAHPLPLDTVDSDTILSTIALQTIGDACSSYHHSKPIAFGHVESLRKSKSDA